MSDAKIPVMRTPANVMDVGPNGTNLSSSAKQRHPVDTLQQQQGASFRGFLDLDGVRRLYGSGLAMKLATERSMAQANGGRLPGMEQNSNLLLDTVTGRDVTLGFEDVLNIPEESPVARIRSPQTAMESKLGL
jgi:proteasome maturation protein